jgi:peptidoglycan/LPS O-acetylase OafA/YrhL
MTRRIQNIQALRGVAVLMVVMIHLAAMEVEFGGGERLLPPLLGFGWAGVDLFFVISGFIMVAVTAGAGRGPGVAAEFLYHRATRIYPVYWFYSAVLIGLHELVPRFANPARWAAVSIPRSLLLLPQVAAPVLAVGWTMVHEIYFYLVFALFLFAPERLRPTFLAVWLAAAVVMPAFLSPAVTPLAAVVTHPLTTEFVAGAAIALLARRGARVPGVAALVAGALLLVGGYVLFAPAIPGSQAWPAGWSRVAVFGLPSTFLLAGAVSLEFSSRRLLPSWLRMVGDASYSIYLVQIFLVLGIGRLWSKVQAPGLADNLAAVTLAAAAIVSAGFLSHRLLERPSLAFARGLWKRRHRGDRAGEGIPDGIPHPRESSPGR